jgi:hypothetical protein
MVKKKIFTIFLLFILLLFMFNTSLMVLIPQIKIVKAGDITSYYNNVTYLSLKTPIPEQEPPGPPGLTIEPIINWYDFQNFIGVSKLNSQIDVNQEYKFCISIRSDQGWDDIEYIDITAWFDNGAESTIYNNSENLGGNLNLFLRYQNTTGTANYIMFWPDDEVTIGSFTEKVETNSNNISGDSETYNLTFSFIPGYQFRYAPGDGSWDYTNNSFNDIWSWNFKISVTDRGENASGPSTVSVIDEFGVYSYSEIVSIGMLTIQGIPGENATTASSVSINTRSNVDYSLSVDIDTLVHESHPTANISNQTMWVQDGNLNIFTNFMGNAPIYLYGSVITYVDADDNNSSKTTDNIDYKCDIPLAQLPGNYTGTIYYQLRTKT